MGVNKDYFVPKKNKSLRLRFKKDKHDGYYRAYGYTVINDVFMSMSFDYIKEIDSWNLLFGEDIPKQFIDGSMIKSYKIIEKF